MIIKRPSEISKIKLLDRFELIPDISIKSAREICNKCIVLVYNEKRFLDIVYEEICDNKYKGKISPYKLYRIPSDELTKRMGKYSIDADDHEDFLEATLPRIWVFKYLPIENQNVAVVFYESRNYAAHKYRLCLELCFMDEHQTYPSDRNKTQYIEKVSSKIYEDFAKYFFYNFEQFIVRDSEKVEPWKKEDLLEACNELLTCDLSIRALEIVNNIKSDLEGHISIRRTPPKEVRQKESSIKEAEANPFGYLVMFRYIFPGSNESDDRITRFLYGTSEELTVDGVIQLEEKIADELMNILEDRAPENKRDLSVAVLAVSPLQRKTEWI